jgi:hypothetical protein
MIVQAPPPEINMIAQAPPPETNMIAQALPPAINNAQLLATALSPFPTDVPFDNLNLKTE